MGVIEEGTDKFRLIHSGTHHTLINNRIRARDHIPGLLVLQHHWPLGNPCSPPLSARPSVLTLDIPATLAQTLACAYTAFSSTLLLSTRHVLIANVN